MSGFRFKKRKIFILFLFALFFILNFTLTLRAILSAGKDVLIQSAQYRFQLECSVEKVSFVFPNYVVFKNVVISDSALGDARSSCVIPRISFRFSFWELLSKHYLVLTHLNFFDLQLEYPFLKDFVTRYREELMSILLHLPRQNMKVVIHNAKIKIFPKNKDEQFIHWSTRFKIQGKDVLWTGQIAPPVETKLPLLTYRLKGKFTFGGFAIDQLSFQREDFYLQTWGDLQNNALQLKGFAFVHIPQKKQETASEQIMRRINPHLSKDKILSLAASLDPSYIHVLDMDARLRFALPYVKIEAMNFYANHVPARLAGSFLLVSPMTFEGNMDFFPSHSQSKTQSPLKQVRLDFSGFFKEKLMISESTLRFNFSQDQKSRYSPEEVNIHFQDFEVGRKDKGFVQLSLKEAKMFFQEKEKHLKVNHVRASYLVGTERFKIFDIYAPFYDGLLDARLWIDPEVSPWGVNAVIHLIHVDVHQMQSLSEYFKKIHGRLYSHITLSNAPRWTLRGENDLHNGHWRSLGFLSWVADVFDLPSLRDIEFQRASCDFRVTPQRVDLQEISLSARDMSLRGNFGLENNNRVNGKFSLTLARPMLEHSLKLGPLVGLLPMDISDYVFDFQLSGPVESVNFQWLDSSIKRTLQDKIPNFIERRIERNVEEMMETPPIPVESK